MLNSVSSHILQSSFDVQKINNTARTAAVLVAFVCLSVCKEASVLIAMLYRYFLDRPEKPKQQGSHCKHLFTFGITECHFILHKARKTGC